jgi:hypothetical protein
MTKLNPQSEAIRQFTFQKKSSARHPLENAGLRRAGANGWRARGVVRRSKMCRRSDWMCCMLDKSAMDVLQNL